MRGRNSFFGERSCSNRASAEGDVTDTDIVETVDETAVEVGDTIDTLGDEDNISEEPTPKSEEVSNELPTVQPTIINGVYTGYGYPFPTTFPPQEPIVVLDNSKSIPNESNAGQNKFLITWLLMVGIGLILLKTVAKKV